MKTKTFSNPSEVDYNLMKQDRIAAGLDQEACGDVLGLDASTISSWESNKRTPKINHLVRFAKLMNKDPKRYLSGNALREVAVYIARTTAITEFVGI